MTSPAKSVSIQDFRLLFESSPALYLVLNPDLQVVAASDAYLRATGVTREEILGSEVFAVLEANDDDADSSRVMKRLRQSLTKVLRDRIPDAAGTLKYRLRRPESQGGGYEEMNWIPVNWPVVGRNNEVLYIINCLEDVAQHGSRPNVAGDEHPHAVPPEVQTEENIRAAQLREVNRNRLEALGRLAGGVAHDFNNLLGIVLGNARLAQEAFPVGSPLHKQMEHIALAANRAADLTRQLLAYSRQQVLELKVLNINDVLLGVSPIIRRLIGENIEIRVMPAQNPHFVKADSGQLEQIIMNLAINARDAMPNGGKLVIESSNITIDDAYRKQHPGIEVKEGPYVMLAVSDTGIGMDTEIQQHIFEPFFTTKAEGTGLGLATVYGIVKQSSGYVWVYSERGKGTTFRVYLPRTGEAQVVLNPVKSAPPPVTGSETILLVEDEPMLRELVQGMLESSGYMVLAADRPGDAIRFALIHQGVIDVVLSDVVMPGMNGRELVGQISVLRPDARILFMSAFSEDVVQHHGELINGMGFIRKPFTKDGLCLKIREVLGTRVRS
jgi:signal transduction histidine kinase/CheY-like chemotaxis protein